MSIWHRSLALIFCGLLLATTVLAKDNMKSSFRFEGKLRTYYCFVPDREGRLPLVVLLHGSGRDGLVMAEAWRSLAAKEQFIIAAPDSYDSWAWQSDKDSPNFLRAMVEQVNARHPVDASRIYLFWPSLNPSTMRPRRCMLVRWLPGTPIYSPRLGDICLSRSGSGTTIRSSRWRL
jgi:hypothetical protein